LRKGAKGLKTPSDKRKGGRKGNNSYQSRKSHGLEQRNNKKNLTRMAG